MSAAASSAAQRGASRVGPAALAGLSLLMALSETRCPSITGSLDPVGNLFRIGLGLVALLLAIRAAHGLRLPFGNAGTVIALAFAGSLVAGQVGGVAWPNSGDEHSYVFLADLLLHGRIATEPPPDLALFETFHVLVHDGWLYSPYPPGWSMLLAPFRAVGAMALVNPLLTVLLGVAIAGILVRLCVAPQVCAAAVALVLLTPFTLFLGGSVFPQTLAATLVAVIVWLQVLDEVEPGRLRKVAVGLAFGVLLMTRYDVLVVAALPYAVDRLAARRLAVLGDAAWTALGFLPFAALHLGYNLALTGHALTLPATWAGTDELTASDLNLQSRVMLALLLNLKFTGGLAEFGGLATAVLAMLGLLARIRARCCRFWDFLLPCAVVFYSFMPFSGGHQYGPRYWFWAFPLCAVTIATAFVDTSGVLRIGSCRVPFAGLAACSLLCGCVSFCGLLATTRTYMQARRAVYSEPPPIQPATVLIPDRALVLWSWQAEPIVASSLDFTRNDLSFTGAVLYGRADLEDSVFRACRLPVRHVYRWVAPGGLQLLGCS